ncbi:MAG: YegS/Rv2252/BmrU family lipid kinase [Bacilli bacterium]|nr:YegS/Rv2252/BmrU family lipid kinase [Bacilli bacterium]
MKHVFIVNPKAGKRDITPDIEAFLHSKSAEFQYDFHVTTDVNDAFQFTQAYCKAYPEEKIRFYACGGDGTLNEVTNGIIGYPNVSLACYPSGSGNDFIKNFGTYQDFLNLDALVQGEEKTIDVFKVNDRYTINICNLGFDAVAADNMTRIKNKRWASGKAAYNLGVFYSLLFSMKSLATISVDGQVIAKDAFLLCTAANGICYGGGYYCAPRASVDDGYLDVMVVKPISRLRFISIIKVYKQGKHLDDPRLQSIITYVRGKKVEIAAPKPIIYCMDGEIAHAPQITMEIVPQAVKFVIPTKKS